MRHDEIPVWHTSLDKRYGSYTVRQDMPGYKKGDGVIVIYADADTAALAGQAPDFARLLANFCLTKLMDNLDATAAAQILIKFQRDARTLLRKAGVDLSEPATESELLSFNVPELKNDKPF